MAASNAPSTPRLPGIIAGRYQPLRELGRGGMGTVYEATHTWTGRRVALKTMLPHLASDSVAVERFRREARAGVRGAHPHIVDVLDMGVDPESGIVFLAQELLHGEEFAALIDREAPLSIRRTYEVLVPVMAALDAAHRAGVIHRDVKPGNVFLAVGAGGAIVPKVIDFGIAALTDGEPVTCTGALLGTPQYMAPEQARGESHIDARADVWAVGCLWFEALTGKRPVPGENYQALLLALMMKPAPSLRAAAPALPAALCDAVERALQPQRARRHASMAAFARAVLAAPCCADASWGVALAQSYDFDEPLDGPVHDEAEAPTTLDLPGETVAAAVAMESLPSPVAEPPIASAAPERESSRRWRSIAIVAIGLAVCSSAALVAWTVRSLSPPPAPRVVVAPPAVTRITVAPAPPAMTPPPAVTPMADAGAASRARPLLRRAPVRHRVVSPEGLRPTVINGAPVLAP